jgi:Flp pilus assembly pilin Flp
MFVLTVFLLTLVKTLVNNWPMSTADSHGTRLCILSTLLTRETLVMRSDIRFNTHSAMNLLLQLALDELGQDHVEYPLLITFIAIACIAFISSVQPATQAVWQTANSEISVANTIALGH